MFDPKALKYTPTHEWVHLDGEIATIGISRFAVDQLADLILIDLTRAVPGSALVAGKPFGEIESVKAVADLYAPISGEIVEVNTKVREDVQLLAQDPYEEGWLLKLKVKDTAQVAALMDQTQYEAQLSDSPH